MVRTSYNYRGHKIVFGTVSVVVYSSDGYIGEFPTAVEAEEYLDYMLDREE